MAKLAAGEAMTAGFRLVSREPAAFGVWVLLELLVGFVPSVLLQLGAPDLARDPAILTKAPWLILLSLVATIVLGTVLACAILRAGIEPEKRGTFYLRLGGQEGWLFLSGLVLGITWAIFAFVFMLALTIVVGIAAVAAGGNPAVGIIMIIVIYVGLLAASIWFFVRLGLLLPIAMHERRLGFGDAWRLSAGNAGPIFGILAALTAVLLVAYAVIFGAVVSIIAAKTPLDQLSQTLQSNPALVSESMTPTAILALGLLLVLVSALVRVMFFGAWADIYRQLKVEPAVEVFA